MIKLDSLPNLFTSSLPYMFPWLSMNNLMYCSNKFANLNPTSLNRSGNKVMQNTDPLNYFTSGIPNFEEGVYFQGLNALTKTSKYISQLVMKFDEEWTFSSPDDKAYLVAKSQNQSTFQKTKVGVLKNFIFGIPISTSTYNQATVDNAVLTQSNLINGNSKKWVSDPFSGPTIAGSSICSGMNSFFNIGGGVLDISFNCNETLTTASGQGIGKSNSLEPELLENSATLPKAIILNTSSKNVEEYIVECYSNSGCPTNNCLYNKCTCETSCANPNEVCSPVLTNPSNSICQKTCNSDIDCGEGYTCGISDGVCHINFEEYLSISCEDLENHKNIKLNIDDLRIVNKLEQCGVDIVEQLIRERTMPQVILSDSDTSRYFRLGTNKRHTDLLDSNVQRENQVLGLMTDISNKPQYYKIADATSVVSGLIGDSTDFTINKVITNINVKFPIYDMIKGKVTLNVDAKKLKSQNITQQSNLATVWDKGKEKKAGDIFGQFLKYDMMDKTEITNKDDISGNLKIYVKIGWGYFSYNKTIFKISLNWLLDSLYNQTSTITPTVSDNKSVFKKIFSYETDNIGDANIITAQSDTDNNGTSDGLLGNHYFHNLLDTIDYTGSNYHGFCESDTITTTYTEEIPNTDPKPVITKSKKYDCNPYLDLVGENYNTLLINKLMLLNAPNNPNKCARNRTLCIPSPDFFRNNINELKESTETGESLCSNKGSFDEPKTYLQGISLGDVIKDISDSNSRECIQNVMSTTTSCSCSGSNYGYCNSDMSCVKANGSNNFQCVTITESNYQNYQHTVVDNEIEMVEGEISQACQNAINNSTCISNTQTPSIMVINSVGQEIAIGCQNTNNVNPQTGKKIYKCNLRPDFYVGYCDCFTEDESAVQNRYNSCSSNSYVSQLTSTNTFDNQKLLNKCDDTNEKPLASSKPERAYCTEVTQTETTPVIIKECKGLNYLEEAIAVFFPMYEIIFENNKPCFTNDDCTKYDEDDNVITGICTSNICNY